jgi:hypothetical protein
VGGRHGEREKGWKGKRGVVCILSDGMSIGKEMQIKATLWSWVPFIIPLTFGQSLATLHKIRYNKFWEVPERAPQAGEL